MREAGAISTEGLKILQQAEWDEADIEAEQLAKAEALKQDRIEWEARIAKSRAQFAEHGLDFDPQWIHPLWRLFAESYEKYRGTSDWKEIRKRILKRDKRLCQLCGNKAQCMHHISYDEPVILGERDEDLISLCNPCHEGIELDGTRHRDVDEKLILLLRQKQAARDLNKGADT